MRDKSISTLRIIAGTWRSRKIKFLSQQGLRPTHDRIRETLFNWLNKDIINSICLDLFAGSGALGFEALSRGAKHVTFVDVSTQVIQLLKENALHLKTNDFEIIQGDFTLEKQVNIEKKFDIVFLDPPFNQNLFIPACIWLEENKLLQSDALIYGEVEKGFNLSNIPDNWSVIREKNTKNIVYFLCERHC